ncbi:MAG TPA: hypothetical protein DCS15_01960 [Flavobacteriales bacterium]|nr:dihydrofolate reductase family protein [Salibacteraceae bacterium]HAS35225.1 hypothetical protein [Flavobacteriales bacterium]
MLTSSPSSFSSDVAVALKEPILSHCAQLKEQSKEDIWLIGGGKANALFLDAGLIDEFIFTYIPKTLGKGIRIFEGDASLNSYSLVEHKFYPNGVFQIRFVLKN